MKKINTILTCLLFTVFFIPLKAQDITLPAPDKKGGKPLMQVLNERKSSRSYSQENLSQQQISDILWAAWGYNRPEQKMRTAPSAMNLQEIDVYVALSSGLYLYEASAHKLIQISNKDIRGLTGSQDFVATAPLNLIYVADMAKLSRREGDTIKDADLLWSYANTGFISQNVYLYCASAGLVSVVRGLVPKEKLAPAMGLRSNQVIILSQTVGYPGK
ncbi:MAG: SagB/ThcOx family dehydrogenase [Bacteroidales bacterium]|nr:SagB/ThcOx family dehydrogenase [Bacteroidales bacterium]